MDAEQPKTRRETKGTKKKDKLTLGSAKGARLRAEVATKTKSSK